MRVFTHEEQLERENQKLESYIASKQLGDVARIASPNSGIGAIRAVMLIGRLGKNGRRDWIQAIKFWNEDYSMRALRACDKFNRVIITEVKNVG